MAKCSGCGEETYRYTLVDGQDLCHDCHRVYIYHRKPVFPFTTSNIAGPDHPITVNSLYHLRQVERDYGVRVAALDMDEKHMSAEEFCERVKLSDRFRRVPTTGWESRDRG